MGSSLNKFICIGNLTRDIELKYTPKGTAIASGAIALSHVWKDGDGSKHEEVTFIDFEAWGRTAEVIEEWAKKGDRISFEGRMKQDTWEDKQTGQKRSKLKLVVENMVLLGARKASDASPERPKTTPKSPAAKPPPDPDLDPADDEDIPFD